MRLTLEPWSPSHDTSVFDSAGAETDSTKDLNLRIELDSWQPVQTSRTEASFRKLYFADGRRRLEGKVYADWTEAGVRYTAPGILGTYAVGLAEIDGSAAGSGCRVVRASVRRVLVLGGHQAVDDLRIPASGSRLGDLEYECVSVPESHNRENALEQKLQRLMREGEARLVGNLERDHDLLVVDGPLPLERTRRALGYVKTLHQLMVGPVEQRTLFALQRGQRTPVFQIGGRLDRYSWFLRLETPPAWHQGLAGIVRLEVHADSGLEWARAVADWSCLNLPRLAARAFRDPRAPQQLMPVAFLEAELGRRMGNPNIVRRRIQAHLHAAYGILPEPDDAPHSREEASLELN